MLACAVGALMLGAVEAPAAKDPDPEIRVLRPLADAFVNAARPTANYGRARRLVVDAAPVTRIYVRFDLRQLKAGVEGATLLLHARSPLQGTVQVRSVDSEEWTERGITYANAPATSSRAALSRRPVRPRQWTAVDVTDLIATAGSSEQEGVSLAVTTASPRRATFSSRESSKDPRLVIQLKRDEGNEKSPPEQPAPRQRSDSRSAPQ